VPVWAWILIAVVVLAVIAVAAWSIWHKRRTEALRQRFGPEYDRTLAQRGKRREAESELDARRRRREELDIRPLSVTSRERYAAGWRTTQGRFVDSPGKAVGEADELVLSVMRERGYPMDTFDQRSADISVDYPQVVENYRAAHGISMANDHGQATTEDLRQAMVHYRALFEELLTGEEPDEAREVR
jgi:hypothetical protein